MRKRFLSIMIALLILLSLAVPAFADTQNSSDAASGVPEAVALVEVDNPDCGLIDKIGELNVKIVLKSDGSEVAKIPVTRVEQTEDDTIALWLGYQPEKIDAEIKAKMKDFQKDFHLESWAELKAMIESSDGDELDKYLSDMENTLNDIFANYTVELTGLPEADDHEFKTESGAMLLTSDIVKSLLKLAKDIIAEALELTPEQADSINSFAEMLSAVEQELRSEGILEDGDDIFSLIEELTEIKLMAEEKAQFNESIAKLDETLAYMKSEAYTGTVIAGVYVTCGCPVHMEYEIIHQYFKSSNGTVKLVGTEMYGPEDGYYEGWSGDLIKASDYIRREYKGETYEYIGSYASEAALYDQEDVDELYDDESWWSESELSELVLDENSENSDGLVLRYEIKSDAGNAAPTDKDSPDTGDHTFMLLYAVIMVISALGAIVVIISNKRQKDEA